MIALQQRRLALWLVAPAVVFVIVLGAFPVLSQFVLSTTEFNLKFPDQRGFVGADNYVRLVTDSVFWQDLGHTFYFTFVSVGLELVLGLGAALLLNRVIRGRTALTSSLMMPWALPTVVAATMWSLILNDRIGLVNSVLSRLHIITDRILWLGPKFAMTSVIIADVWKTTPFVAIILLAGLKSIPRHYYEAAELDGANRWQTFRSITLPLLKPFIAVAVLFRAMDAFRIFDLVWVLTGGASGTETLSVYIYKVLFRYSELGYGSTLTVALFAIVFMLSLALIRSMRVEAG
ncbi:MAG: ABC transporter permease subunit [Candidatus Eisenbacteria bacterium]|nr:ABC transporter permease subunit [Candidatus Eisenbacteria bacterium]